jgi:hypothetical protein
MDTTGSIWTEQMLAAQRSMLEVQGRRIRSLERLLHSVLDMVQGGFAEAIPVREIRESLMAPLLPGLPPSRESTQVTIIDPEAEAIKASDPIKTVELPTLVAQGLADGEVAS